MRLRPLLFIAAGAVALGALVLVFRPDTRPGHEDADPRPSTFAVSSGRRIALQVKDRKRIVGPAVIRVFQGESVTLDVLSDQPGHLHLHGYDLMLTLDPEQAATLTFIADRSGRFEYELEEAGVELGALEVEPR